MSHHVLTCIVAPGKSGPVVERLVRDKDIWNVYVARSRHAVADFSGRKVTILQSIENEEIVILVPDERADEIFRWCWDELRIGEPGNGTLLLTRAFKAAEMVAPRADPAQQPVPA